MGSYVISFGVSNIKADPAVLHLKHTPVPWVLDGIWFMSVLIIFWMEKDMIPGEGNDIA